MTISQKTVLITGANGFLGKAVARIFRTSGWTVRSVSRHPSPTLEQMGIKSFLCDLSKDLDALFDAVQDCDAVIHCAAKAGVWGSRDSYYRANVIATQNVLDACLRAEIKALVLTSSPSVVFNGKDIENGDESLPYPDHFENFYSETKALSERAALKFAQEHSHIRVCVLRPHLIWGPGDPHLLPRLWARAAKLRIIGDGTNRVDAVYIDNAAKAHYLAVLDLLSPEPKSNKKTYFITNNEPIELWSLINRLLAVRGIRPISKKISVNNALMIAKIIETVYHGLGIKREPQLTTFVVKEMSTSHWFSQAAAQKDLGYHPHITMDAGIEILTEYEHNLAKQSI